jgi:hypothetical protein
MSPRVAAWLAYSVLAMAVILGALGSVLLMLNDRFPPPAGETLLAFVAFLIVGVVIASRRPENPIGWMFCLIGGASVLEFFTQEYAYYALVTRPGALPGGVWMAWSQVLTASGMWTLMLFALLLFPDGRLPSPRWRPFACIAAGTLILVSLLSALEPGRLQAGVPNPTGIERAAGIIEMCISILIFVVFGVVLVTAASVIVRFWRATGVERQQLKWLAYTAGFLGGSLGLALLNAHVLDNRLIEFAAGLLGVVAIAAVPTAIGVAILRYRLYDIDIIINRTLVYGSLTATLALVYLGSVVGLQAALRVLTGQESTLAVVASTLAIAALFSPLRRRIQAFIDRRFYRRKYDAARTLEAFNARLRDETGLDALSGDVVGVVRQTMQPEHVSLWLRSDTASRHQRTD